MSRRGSAVRDYVRQNIELLLSSEDRGNEIKTSKFRYFRDKLQGAAGMPKNKEIALEICGYLLDTRRVATVDDLKSAVNRATFLRKNIFERDWPSLHLILEKKESEAVLSSEDLREMHREEFVAKKQQEIVERARDQIVSASREVTKQMQEEIEARYKDMLDQLTRDREQLAADRAAFEREKSEADAFMDTPLEDIPYSAPETGTGSKASVNATWWDRLGLFGNPFPTVDGLSKIDEQFYDSLVLRTPVFQSYLELVTGNPDEILNKTYLLVGEFGSGKTTLFDYLKKPLTTHDILPVHLLIDAESDRERIRRSFYRAFVKQVAEKYHSISQVDPRSLYDEIGKEELLEILQEIVNAKKLQGVVAMVDGLHKNESLLREALGFVQVLQNTKDYWVREGLNIGFVVAGSRSWQRELDLNAAVRGSLYRIDALPGITAAEAFEMLSKRLATFSRDPKRPAKVRRAAIDKLYKYLGAKYSRDITFRDVVEETLPYLERNDLGYVEISIPFDKDLLARLRNQLEGDKELKARIDRLRQRPDAFLSAIQALSMLLERKRVSEKDELFRANVSLFAMLNNVGLVQRFRAADSGKPFWAPARVLIDFGRKVELQVGLKPSEFLTDLFKGSAETHLAVEPDEVLKLRTLISSYRSSDSVLGTELQRAQDLHLEISRHASSAEDIIPAAEICEKTREGLEPILKALFLSIEPRTILPFGEKSAEGWLRDSWVSPQEVSVYWEEVRRCAGQPPEPKQAAEITRAYLRAFKVVASLVDVMLRCNSIVNLSTPDLRNPDKVVLHDARSKFAMGDFLGACRTLTDYMESRMRGFLYDILTLKYGEKWRARLGRNANDYIVKEKTRAKTILPPGSPSLNDLFYCTRQHYRPIVTEVPGNWDQVFQYAFAPETSEYVNSMLQLTFTLADKDKHNLTNEYFRENQDKLLMALQASGRLLSSVNRAYIRMLEPENVYVEAAEDDATRIYFSFMRLTDKSNLTPLTLSNQAGHDIAIRIAEKLKGAPLRLDLADHDAVEYAFGIKHRETLGVLGYAVKERKLVFEPLHGSYAELRLPKPGST